jgi:hypothetical protein
MKRTDLKSRLRLVISFDNDDGPRVFDRLVSAPNSDVARAVGAGVSAFSRAFDASLEAARQRHAEKENRAA